MTSAGSKRASWQLRLALVAAGFVGLVSGSVVALTELTRKSREVASAERALKRADVFSIEKVEGFEQVQKALETAAVDSAVLASFEPPGLEDLCVVALPVHGPHAAVLWAKRPKEPLARTLEGEAGLPDKARLLLWRMLVPRSRDSLGQGSAFLPSRVEDDRVHCPVLGVALVSGPSPVAVVYRWDFSEPVESVWFYFFTK